MRRYIAPNKGVQTVRHYLAVDTETRDIRNNDGTDTHMLWYWYAVKFTLRGGRVGGQRDRSGSTADEFWSWVYSQLDRRATTWLVAHYAAYDITALRIWDEMAAGRLRLRRVARGAAAAAARQGAAAPPPALCCTHDPPTVLDLVCPGRGRLVVVDTMNWFPLRLADVAASLGSYQIPDVGDAASDEDWRLKCRLDAYAVRDALASVVGWVKENDLGNQRYTAAGQGLQAWRHGRQDCEISVGHPPEVKAMERESYYPGYLRAYFLGCVERADTRPFREAAYHGRIVPVEYTGPIYRLDVNAAYPSVMMNNDYPVGYMQWIGTPSVTLLGRLLESHEGCACVQIDSKTLPYPVREDKRVRFARGLFWTYLCGPDLRRALAAGHVRQCSEAHLHKRGRPFDTVTKHFLALREKYRAEGNAALAIATKIAINSLHGKFMQWGGGWRSCDEHREALPFEVWAEFDSAREGGRMFRMLGSDLQENVGREERDESYPLIGAYVTAYARQQIETFMSVAGERNVYYIDVDSIHVSEEGFRRLERYDLIDQSEPGKLKVEAVADTAQYHGPKVYQLGPRKVAAGVSPHAKPDCEGILRQRHFMRLGAMLAGLPPLGPVTEDVPAPVPVPKNDGTAKPGGWLDYPWIG